MRIAVDACTLYRPLTGVGRYTYELCRELSRYPDTELLFGCGWRWQKDFPKPLSHGSRRRIEAIRTKIPGGQALIYRMKALAYQALSVRHQPDIVFAPGFLIPPVPAPTVITVHDLSHLRYPETHPESRSRLFRRHLARSIQRATKILTISRFSAAEIASEFPGAQDRLTIIPPGIGDAFSPIGEEKAPPPLLGDDKRSYFLFLATLEPRKNLLQLLKAYEHLPLRIRRDHCIVVAGEFGWKMGPAMGALERMVREGSVKLTGYVPDVALPALYRGATAFVYPSLYEGFGLPPLEAMACGCVAVASNAGAIMEACQDAALYVDPLDTENITAAMTRIVEDASLRAVLKERGLERARAFRWDQSGRELRAVFQQVAN